jgi:hypothetical protein
MRMLIDSQRPRTHQQPSHLSLHSPLSFPQRYSSVILHRRYCFPPHQQKRGGAAPSYCQGRGGGAAVTLVAIQRYGMLAIGNIAISRCHRACKKKFGGYQCVRYASGRYSQGQKIDIVASLVVDAHYGLSHADASLSRVKGSQCQLRQCCCIHRTLSKNTPKDQKPSVLRDETKPTTHKQSTGVNPHNQIRPKERKHQTRQQAGAHSFSTTLS